jgi:hypothetical protein
MNVLFFQTSIINVSKDPLNYSPIRSVYDPETRLQQTIEGVNSVRAKYPSAKIFVCEASNLDDYQEKKLKECSDNLILLHDVSEVKDTRNHSNKSLAEATQVKHILSNPEIQNYDFVFKMSGRYWLSDSFNPSYIQNKNKAKVIVKKRFSNPYRHWFSTSLYCVGKYAIPMMINQLDKAIEILKYNNTDIESTLFRGIENTYLIEVDSIGCSGRVAVNGEIINH